MSTLVERNGRPFSDLEDGPYTVVPGHVPALSKAGKAWFTAHRRNLARVTEPGDVRQDLGDLARACKAGCEDRQAAITAAVKSGFADLRQRAVKSIIAESGNQLTEQMLMVRGRDGIDRPGELLQGRMRELADADASACWFAFDDLGSVVLSLRTSRERAHEIALAYNKAGGRLVLLAPSRDLAAVPVEDCVAVAELTAPPPAPKLSPAEVFAGPDGAVYATPHGLVGLRVADEEKGVMDRSNLVLDPSMHSPARARKAKWNAPEPAAVAGMLDEIRPGEVVFEGSAARLPPALPANDKRKPGLVALGGYYFPRSVVAGLCRGRVKIRATAPGYLWIERADGSIAIAAHCGRAE